MFLRPPWTFLHETKQCQRVIPQQAEVTQRVPVRLRPQIFLTFGTARVVCRQPYAPAAFTTGEIPGTHFQRLSRPQGTWFCRGEPRKKSPVTPPGTDPETVGLVAQCLNHYATPRPQTKSELSLNADYMNFHAIPLYIRVPLIAIIYLNLER